MTGFTGSDQVSGILQGVGMHTLHASFAQVKATRELFILLLGRGPSKRTRENEIHVELAEQILLSPSAAKNLAVKLNEAIRSHEARFGSPGVQVIRYEKLVPTPTLTPPRFKSPDGARKIALCFQLLEKFNIKPAFERSFQIQEKKLLKNRFLFGFEVDSIAPRKNEKILHICEQMGMPPVLMADFMNHLPGANIAGFGFGEDETTCIVRAYLEFKGRYYRAGKDKTVQRDPYVSHLGFKWDAADGSVGFTTTYTCYPGYTTEDMLENLAQGLYRNGPGGSYDIVEGILKLASGKAGNEKFLFLDVSEENNERHSFDINLYEANLQLNDIYPFLIKACHLYSISENEFHDFYEPVKAQILGHIAGGINRDGNDFLSLYFGE